VIRVAAFTAGWHIPGSRFRVRQYVQALRAYGIELREFFARLGAYPPTGKLVRPFWAVGSLASRLPSIMRSYRYDVILFQREMLSTFFTLEPFTKKPRILDVDDAIWLNGDGSFARRLARISDAVICGNSFLAEQFSQWNSNVTILPTAVDTDRFRPLEGSSKRVSQQIIGWSGLGAGMKYLFNIERALGAVLKKRKDTVLRVLSDIKPTFSLLDNSRVEYVRWSPQNEVETIQEMLVGLMPIEDSPWTRGKCSYKMLLYMSCGLPVVVSPVGMNNEVLAHGNAGFGPRSDSEWVDCIIWLLDNPAKAAEMGKVSRKIILQHYSLDVLSPLLAGYIKTFSN
jgi:glycosyltransferase involved in cell wall biosynthesis